MADAVDRYYVNSARSPHDWGPWLEFADQLEHAGGLEYADGRGRARYIRTMYAILHGGWGDRQLHETCADLVSDGAVLPRIAKATVCGQLTLIPPGSFVMGSPETEPGHRYDEAQVPVTLTHGFWLGLQPVTNYIWWYACGTPKLSQRSSAVRTDVSWHEAKSFLAKLNKKHPIKGWRFDLPTEAQWEYACRAGATTPYTTVYPKSSGLKYSPNGFALYGMGIDHGEWCRDGYRLLSPGGVDPCAGDSLLSCRVVRGPAFVDVTQSRRVAHRSEIPSRGQYPSIGFRVALVVDV